MLNLGFLPKLRKKRRARRNAAEAETIWVKSLLEYPVYSEALARQMSPHTIYKVDPFEKVTQTFRNEISKGIFEIYCFYRFKRTLEVIIQNSTYGYLYVDYPQGDTDLQGGYLLAPREEKSLPEEIQKMKDFQRQVERGDIVIKGYLLDEDESFYDEIL